MRARYRVEPSERLSRKEEEENNPATVPDRPGPRGRGEAGSRQDSPVPGPSLRHVAACVACCSLRCSCQGVNSALEQPEKGVFGIFP